MGENRRMFPLRLGADQQTNKNAIKDGKISLGGRPRRRQANFELARFSIFAEISSRQSLRYFLLSRALA